MVGFKNRYMVMEIFVDPNRELGVDEPIILTQFNITKAIKDSILVNFGECGLGSSFGSFQVKYVNPTTNLCIVRVSREEYQKVWSSITLVTSIGNCPVLFNLLDLSVQGSLLFRILDPLIQSRKGGRDLFQNLISERDSATPSFFLVEDVAYNYKIWMRGNIKACRKAALKCDELKFEQYKLVVGTRLSDEKVQQVHNCQDKLKLLEH